MRLLLNMWSIVVGAFLIISHCEAAVATVATKATVAPKATEKGGDHADIAGDISRSHPEGQSPDDAEFTPGDAEGAEEVDDAGVEEMSEEEDDGAVPEDGEEEDAIEPLTSDQMRSLHKKFDANGNGKVSLAEISEFGQKMRRAAAKQELDDVMSAKDTNKDGKLTNSEFLGDPGKHKEEVQNEKAIEFRELDENNDKFVDADELTKLFQHHTNDKVEDRLTVLAMKDKDTDKNGMLSLAEFYQHLQQEGEDPVFISPEDKDIFDKLDLDTSGSLTLKELKAWESGSFQTETAIKKLFAVADTNKDNVVTADELVAARETFASDPNDVDAQMHLDMWKEQKGHGEL